MSHLNANRSDSSLNSTTLDENQPFDPETLFKIAIEILRKPPGIRLKSDVNFLIHAFKDIAFFTKLHRENGFDAMKSLCKSLIHQRLDEKDFVFHVGTMGYTFYIILKGAVSVQIPDYGKGFGEMKEIATLYQGQSFGDLALLFDQPRTATIVCKEKCDFAILTRSDFHEILAKIEMKKIHDKIDFFASLPIFKNHTRRNVSTLIYHFEQLNMMKGEVVYNVGDDADYAYVIKSGQVKLQTQIKAEEKFNYEVPDDFYPPKLPKKKIDLVVLGQGEMFGEEDICNETKRSLTAVVSSLRAEIYRISRADFDKRILNSEETAIPVILYSKNKLSWRENHLKEIEDVSNKTRNYFYSPEKPSVPKEKRPRTEETTNSPKRGGGRLDTSSYHNTSMNFTQPLNDTNKRSGLFLTENSFITGFNFPESMKNEKQQSPSPPARKRQPPIPRLNNLLEEKPNSTVKSHNVTIGQATKNFKKQMQIHIQKQKRNNFEIKQLFKSNVFEKIEHKSRLLNRKDLSQTQPNIEYRSKSSKDYKQTYISSRPADKKIRIEDHHISQVQAKERILSGVVKSEDKSNKFFDFAEMLKLHKPKSQSPQANLVGKRAQTYSVSAEPTIVERILQSNEFYREKNRPLTATVQEPFINIHVKNFREKSLFPKNKPRFLTPKSPKRPMNKTYRGDTNFRSAKVEGSPMRRDSSGNGNMDIRALRSGYTAF